MQATWKYHDGTKHSYWSIRNNPHFLDWANRPQPFKIYPKLEPLPLPRDVPQTGVAALCAISEPLPSASYTEPTWQRRSVQQNSTPGKFHYWAMISTLCLG